MGEEGAKSAKAGSGQLASRRVMDAARPSVTVGLSTKHQL